PATRVLYDHAPTPHSSLSLHDALPIFITSFALSTAHKPEQAGPDDVDLEHVDLVGAGRQHLLIQRQSLARIVGRGDHLHLIAGLDRKSTRLNSSHLGISYAVFCLKKKP